MILFFRGIDRVFALESVKKLSPADTKKLNWLFRGAEPLKGNVDKGYFLGPRKEMITPWSTNAVEITRNMGIEGIIRIEELFPCAGPNIPYDPMLQKIYGDPGQEIFRIDHPPEPIRSIDDISTYNQEEGLALSEDEISYLNDVSTSIGRKLTDSEVFGFSQVNSEHCRHKIFNGSFVIDGKEMPGSLFSMIKETSKANPNRIVSAYKDNVAFVDGPAIMQFAPVTQDKADLFSLRPIDSILSLKAETHNFPTTVEPFNGAATGGGGEIRDRMGGGTGSIPLSGTAVYMTSYPRLEPDRSWEQDMPERPWLYHDPADILIKASNGASDFGNKFGQPLTCGSVLTFEHQEGNRKFGFDKVIMLAGGIGYANKRDAIKGIPEAGDKIVVLGGDNYRIGMGGGAVSSVATGEFNNAIELNAVQRSNPEMQKRTYNVTRAFAEASDNPVISIHDHGAGGHLNSLSELVEATGGIIEIFKLPIGDPTLSAKEIIGNESQERMGLIIKAKDVPLLMAIADRERAPAYVVGEVTGDMRFTFRQEDDQKPIDLDLAYLFGKPPQTVLHDTRQENPSSPLSYSREKLNQYIEDLLQLEAVACKDWLTNKVDRSVTGRIAMQQCTGPLQLPLNNMAISALDYMGRSGIATSIGHAPAAMLVDEVKGSELSIAEALTNIIWAPIKDGIRGISLSANWMWPAKNPGENARLYYAVKAVSETAIGLGINIPTGKDSLSMTQKYPDGSVVYSPGTVIISAGAEVTDISKAVTPVLKDHPDSIILHIDPTNGVALLGGSSFGQLCKGLGDKVPGIGDPEYFAKVFDAVQELITSGLVLAGHDIGSGGLITTLLEMTFSRNDKGLNLDLSSLGGDIIPVLFTEKPGLVLQVARDSGITDILETKGIKAHEIGSVSNKPRLTLRFGTDIHEFDSASLRDIWFKTSFLLDRKQTRSDLALRRYANFKKQELSYRFPKGFSGKLKDMGLDMMRIKESGIRAAIIREKGVNGDREMAWSLHLAGFDVKDIHMTDLISGRETLEDVKMIVFVGGFSNSDVLGSAKGWAGAFLYNPKARKALDRFYARKDTLSLGICNGCQLMIELGLVTTGQSTKAVMHHNESGKFESGFIPLDILPNKSVMLSSLAGSRLGVWIAHGEGRFSLPQTESKYRIPVKYAHGEYPGNPNGSDFGTAGLVSPDGRHLAMMPHLERSLHPWQWPWYLQNENGEKGTINQGHEVTPWMEAFVNARKWVEKKR